VQNSRAADGKTENGSQRGNQQEVGAEVKDVGEDGGDGENESQHVKPEGSAYRSAQIFIRVSVFFSAQAQLQQESRQPNGSDDDQCERTEEGRPASVDHYEGEGGEQQTRGNDTPAAWLGHWDRVGSGIGQEVSSQVIQGEARVFK